MKRQGSLPGSATPSGTRFPPLFILPSSELLASSHLTCAVQNMNLCLGIKEAFPTAAVDPTVSGNLLVRTGPSSLFLHHILEAWTSFKPCLSHFLVSESQYPQLEGVEFYLVMLLVVAWGQHRKAWWKGLLEGNFSLMAPRERREEEPWRKLHPSRSNAQ